MSAAVISGLLSLGKTAIEKIFPDPAARAEATLKLEKLAQEGKLAEFSAQVEILGQAAEVVKTEAASEHFLTANWRPITMLTFVAIIANNYILYPYLALFWDSAPMLTVPQDMWELIKIGLGGYVVGRSVEKTASAWKEK